MGRAALFLVTGFLIIFGMIQKSVQNRQQVLAERSPEYFYEEQSRNIASSMVEVALAKLNDNPYWTGPLTKNNFMGGEGKITIDNTDAFGSVELTVEGAVGSTTESLKTTINIIANRNAFSIYAYFTDQEKTPNGNAIYFTTGDILNGPAHTNGTIRIYGDPVFNGPISSHGGIYQTWGSDPTFNNTTDFNAKEIELPEEAPGIVDLAKTENGGIGEFNDDIFVEFKEGDPSVNNDGTVEISDQTWECIQYSQNGNCAAYNEVPDLNTTVTYNLADFNRVISTAGNMYVKGKVDGQITIHSKQDVKIMGDLEYENNNHNDHSQVISDDQLGIVSEDDTIVDNSAHSDHGSKDININASVLTLKGSFTVENYDEGGDRGTINLLGGLIQRTRGPVGLVDGTGYSKSYTYDQRFQKNSTPGFPKMKRFKIESWKEKTVQGSI